MADQITSITDLPLDILVLVFPYLDAKSFLAFCSTCKAFQQNSIRLDPVFWRHATQATFRVPNQPVVQNDGVRWQKLFRRLSSQSRVFTWGKGQYNRLGHNHKEAVDCLVPLEMDQTRDLGIIADLQCGGWSTTILTSNGSLYMAGVLNGMQEPWAPWGSRDSPLHLRFSFAPFGDFSSTALAACEEPTTRIRRFSSGRSHILGLSDSGRIWSWYTQRKPALHVKFLEVDVTEESFGKSLPENISVYGRVKQVVAGWSLSSAYIYGVGIVVWDPVERADEDFQTDTMLVLETVEIPKTGYQRTKGASRESDEDRDLGEEVGAVLNYIILEHYVVFVTDIGKVFCGRFGEKNQVEEILELRALHSDMNSPVDVQGSFRRFAIFENGEVITANQEYLEACWNVRHSSDTQADIGGLQRIPALQHNDVISIAFGDYHFLALHSNGKITSYGTEVRSCGALGLGEGTARGLQKPRHIGGDRKLLPHAYTRGRQVWFERAKRDWLRYLLGGGEDPEEAAERLLWFNTETIVQGEVSEWFEQEGCDWDKLASESIEDDDGLGSYFALSVSAAGWHSGALVLVNEKLARRVEEMVVPFVGLGSWGRSFLASIGQGLPSIDKPKDEKSPSEVDGMHRWTHRSFPRLKLSDGREMPGSVEFDEWRFGRPEWQLDIDV